MIIIPIIYKSERIAKEFLLLAEKEGKTLTPMQLIKLVYLSHAWMLALYNRPLIDEPIEAWRYGPVISVLYQAIKNYRSNPVERIDCEDVTINNEALDVITQVYKLYGEFTGIELSMLTHEKGSPWEVTWNKGRTIISNDLIAYYYKKMNSSGS